MSFLNLALIFEITKRSENLNILMGSILMGAFFSFLIFGIFQLCFKMLRIPREYRFKALLVGANMVIVVLFYRWLASACMGWNDYTMAFSAFVALNTLIFIYKFKYLDK
ncbi:MAG: hypothetical protein US76_00835 [Parcubacteria group bacterium GW2011_GWA2_38_13b]|nr:MAG: hypothetical protein US76_00835 [Parcubacteria group bacterium GW2011_GWA2_38_13b]